MLYFSVVFSLILVVIANVAVHRPRGWLPAFFVCGICFIFGTGCLGFVLPPVAILFVALIAAMLLWRFSKPKPWLFLPLSGLAVAIAAGFTAWSVAESELEYAHLRKMFPYESFEDRLPTPRPDYRLDRIPEATSQHLATAERLLDQNRGSYRVYHLQTLHEQATRLFINSPGFGVARMIHPDVRGLTAELPPDTQVLQPETRLSAAWPPEEPQWHPRPIDQDLFDFHLAGLVDFANPRGFGFVKDRRNVAGFQAHHFTSIPTSANQWAVQGIDLVGLLQHDKPVAYVSDHLPRMDELRDAPTRALVDFEASGLEKIRQGEDLVIGAAGDRIRMLGSLRSAKQCIQCHGGERGDLLGAFSYTLKQLKN